jgi:AAA+ ATPase superfamily predicted ATPase
VEFLMRQELRETAIYIAIIEAVALGNTKLNDIHQKTQIEKAS